MEQENESFAHIIFIFIGVALIAVGSFYLLTDDNSILEDNPIEDKKENKEPLEPKEVEYNLNKIDLELNDEVNVDLNNKNVKISLNEEDSNIQLSFNNKIIVKQKNTGSINIYNYDEYLFVSSTTGEKRFTNLLIFNSNGDKIREYHLDSQDSTITIYQEYENGKLNIYGTKIGDDNLLYISENEEGIDICDIDKLSEKEIDNTSVVFLKYELKYYSDKEFKLVKIEDSKETLIEWQQKYCTGDKEPEIKEDNEEKE